MVYGSRVKFNIPKFRTLYRRSMAISKYGGLRRRTIGSKAARSNRIFRKFIRRSAPKPELKHIEFATNSSALAGSTMSFITPSILQGIGVGQRIGQSLKLIKLAYKIHFFDATTSTGINGAVRNAYPIRYMLWSPRVDYNTALDYMNSVTIRQFIDFDQVTIYKDSTLILHPKVFLNGGTAALNNSGDQCIVLGGAMKYPRKVHFSNDPQGYLDNEKHRIYLTWVIDTLVTGTDTRAACYLNTRVWYFDA